MSAGAIAAAVLAVVLAAFGAGWYFGRQGIELKDSKQIVKQEVAQDSKRRTDEGTVAQEAKTYEAATDPLAPLPAPIVRMCDYSTPAVPSPHPAGSGAHAPPALRAADPPVPAVVEWDTKPLVRDGHNADAQVAGLQDYIAKVCQAHAP